MNTTAPLPLPRYTFIFDDGTNNAHALAERMSELNPDLLTLDFESPIRSATIELLFGGDHALDLLKSNTTPPLIGDAIDIASFIHEFTLWTEERLGKDILGRIALSEVSQFSAAGYIFRDATPHRTLPFPPGSLCIHFTAKPTDEKLRHFRHIWLPEPSIDSQIERLRLELERD